MQSNAIRYPSSERIRQGSARIEARTVLSRRRVEAVRELDGSVDTADDDEHDADGCSDEELVELGGRAAKGDRPPDADLGEVPDVEQGEGDHRDQLEDDTRQHDVGAVVG
jgi:hypothetical protein